MLLFNYCYKDHQFTKITIIILLTIIKTVIIIIVIIMNKLGGFVIQRHNELRDLEAELLSTVRSDVETEPVLLDISGEQLSRGSNKAQDARLDIHARGFWEQQRSTFFNVRVCHPNAESYKDLELQQIYRTHENERKRLYSRRVLDIEHGTFNTFGLHYNRRHGQGMLEIPKSAD